MPDLRYLADTSVFARAGQAAVGIRLEALAEERRLWTCRMVDLELLHGTRSRDLPAVIAERFGMRDAPITAGVMDRALRVAGLLAAAGLHRAAKPPDLIIAAAAETAGLTILHYDADYDRIARVTGQPVEWIAPPGTLDR